MTNNTKGTRVTGLQLDEAFHTLDTLEGLAENARDEDVRQYYEEAARWFRVCLTDLGLLNKYFDWIDDYYNRVSHGLDD